MNIAIFASGTGTNAKKIIEYFENNTQVKVNLIVSNKATAPVLDIARENGIDILVIDRHNFYKTQDILNFFNEYSIDFVVLAGFLLLIPSYLTKSFENKIVNIHPALLPKFGGKGMYGMNVHKAVHEAKEKETGITIHYVNENYDEGAIIFQAKCLIDTEDTPETISNKVRILEHEFFPKIIEQTITNQTET
ncbi:MAG: phosphoribosylglycinamide formyltransferase [Bacteroidetes bacterium]|jgi:phosphoribosylglycinamide formyltransferase-1|nr:phosphoribosylglycinamide formyltransferase [Bacteroidota bacterium]MDF1863570.1 phosphoribosylglycinamide formyltransferase [Saprospiraceae bacterium]